MPIFGIGQKEELNVYEAGYALAAKHGYQPYSTKKLIGKPIHASGFVAGFMYRVFVGNDSIWIRRSRMSSEFIDAIEQGWAAGQIHEAQHKGHAYEANEDEPADEFLSPTVQMFTGNLEQESWRPTFGYPGTFVSDCEERRIGVRSCNNIFRDAWGDGSSGCFGLSRVCGSTSKRDKTAPRIR